MDISTLSDATEDAIYGLGEPLRHTHMQPPAWAFRMPPSQFRRAVAVFAGRCRWPRPGLGTAFLAAPILVASALPLLVFAHESHPAAPPAAVSTEERAFLEEN